MRTGGGASWAGSGCTACAWRSTCWPAPVTSGPELAGRLVQASGVADLQRTLHVQLIGRSQPLKARSALAALSSLLASRSWPQSDRLATRAEMIVERHEIAEVRLLTELWLGELVLRDEAQADELERLLGGRGDAHRAARPAARRRFGDLSAAALEARHRWSQTAEHPMSSMAVKAAAAVRTCEGILAWLTAGQARVPGRDVRQPS